MQSRKRRIADKAGETTTLIGEGANFRGDLSGGGSFIIGGDVSGKCDIAGTITLSRNGHWEGSIRARDVIIAGRVEGEVHATGKLEIASTARICGDISGAEIAIAEGAVVDGEMNVYTGGAVRDYAEKRSSDL